MRLRIGDWYFEDGNGWSLSLRDCPVVLSHQFDQENYAMELLVPFLDATLKLADAHKPFNITMEWWRIHYSPYRWYLSLGYGKSISSDKLQDLQDLNTLANGVINGQETV